MAAGVAQFPDDANTRHTIDLSAKGVQVSVVGSVAVGAQVRLVLETGDQGTRVSVTGRK
ncbi:MAG: hypothetical protein ACM3NQ_05605 [Bacteroidales bacterium]